MARKPRLEFENAIYHVIARGNYRKDLFAEDSSAKSFQSALFEACGKCGWLLHAYVVMSNHYHLALETPGANLVDGMRWLQGTFGIRFNTYHKEGGHVFQSRYKAIVVEPGRPLLGLVNYIHLNPVRAGIVDLEGLRAYAHSSYPRFFSKRPPKPLIRERFLAALEFPDSAAGMRRYAEHLAFSEESDLSARESLQQRYCRGWAVASREYREELKRIYAERSEPAGWAGSDVQEMREVQWGRKLSALLREAGKAEADVACDPKSAGWKIEIAGALRSGSTASNAWIAKNLNMGHPTRVSNLIHSKCKL